MVPDVLGCSGSIEAVLLLPCVGLPRGLGGGALAEATRRERHSVTARELRPCGSLDAAWYCVMCCVATVRCYTCSVCSEYQIIVYCALDDMHSYHGTCIDYIYFVCSLALLVSHRGASPSSRLGACRSAAFLCGWPGKVMCKSPDITTVIYGDRLHTL